MNFPIVKAGIPLILSASFIAEVDNVINNNVDTNVPLIALFISRLIKGLQNLSCSEGGYSSSWGNYSFEIEDIGIVRFAALIDDESGEKAFHVLSISWTFATSHFFHDFVS